MTLARLAQIAIVAAAVGLSIRGPAEDWPCRAAGQSSSTIGLLAIDAVPQGNTATALGPVDGCSRAASGSTFNVDYIVDAIPADRPIIGFEAEIRYDKSLVEVVGVDYQMLLAAVGTYSPLASLSDTVPDSDGEFRISVLDTASSTEPEANVERGPGVLARVTFRANAPGVTKISIGLEKEPFLYPLVLDTQDEMILADTLGGASIAVGVDCLPETAQPEITDLGATNQEILATNPQLRPSPGAAGESPEQPGASTTTGQTSSASSSPGLPRVTPASSGGGDGNGGSGTWLIVLIAVLVALGIAAAGGWYLYQRSHRMGSGS